MPAIQLPRLVSSLVLGICLLLSTLTSPVFAQQKLITLEELQRIAPNARAEFLEAIIDSEDLFRAAGIDTRLRMAHFLAQVMTETGGLARLDENMNYSAKTLLRVFSRKTVSEAKAREIERDPQRVANWVYGERLGNRGRDTQDGWNYRGSGYLQLTGRANFRDRGAQIGVPLEAEPELARTVPQALAAAIAYWQAAGINAAADDHDQLRVRKMVNGPAAHGFDQSKVWFNRAWVKVFRDKEGQGFESGFEMAEERASDGAAAEAEAQLFDQILTESGLISETELANEAGAAASREAALKSFQEELGLPESGVLDEATQDALLDPREWRYAEDEAVPASSTPGDPEQTMVFRFAAAEETGTESSAMMVTEPNSGSGAIVEQFEMSPADKTFISAARSNYSQYEMGGVEVTPETFTPFSVIGTDDRKAVTDTTGFPARAVVQILFENDRGGKFLCSGSMIAKDTVLTAAHCLHSGTVSGAPYRNYRVLPGRNVGVTPFGGCGVVDGKLLSGWVTSLTPMDARYYDLGALKLDCQVGERTGWFGLRVVGDDELGLPTVVHGYAGDRAPTGRQWVSLGALDVMTEFKGYYQNDTFGGTSGAPVYAADAPDTVIGVHTNGVHGGTAPWSALNAFTRITPHRMTLIQSWIGE